jgi:hypothetical protein
VIPYPHWIEYPVELWPTFEEMQRQISEVIEFREAFAQAVKNMSKSMLAAYDEMTEKTKAYVKGWPLQLHVHDEILYLNGDLLHKSK